MNVDKKIIKQQEDNTSEFIKTLGIKRVFNPFTGEAQTEIDRLENELASQKAITELAVKENEQLKKVMTHIRNEAIEALKTPAMFYLVTALKAIKMEVEDAQT